ncbi:MAG: hypothetical protein QOH06_2180 [Acidobacteriota bacterium]|jgi:phage protein D|nr:hypothetical protein [Acidobacteriota bacterium]
MPAIPTFYAIQVNGAPLPRRFLDAVRQIEVETSTEQASAFRLQFDLSKTPAGDWDLLKIDLFRPQTPVGIGISLGKRPEMLINGYVQEARIDSRTEPGRATLEVVGFDATSALMNLGSQDKPWPNQSDSIIATQIFADYKMVPVVEPTPSARTVQQVTTVQGVSDIRFLKLLARRNSYECYVQPGPIQGKDLGHFHPSRLTSPSQAVLSVNFGTATNMEGFHVRDAGTQATSTRSAFIDPITKAIQKVPVQAATERPMGREPALGRVRSRPVARLTGTHSANVGELMSRSRAVVNESSRALRGSGTVDGLKLGRVLRPGLPVLVRGAGREHSGLYYVTQIRHEISDQGHSQIFEAWRNSVGLTGTEAFVDLFAALS